VPSLVNTAVDVELPVVTLTVVAVVVPVVETAAPVPVAVALEEVPFPYDAQKFNTAVKSFATVAFFACQHCSHCH
jgi:hypothetical protein